MVRRVGLLFLVLASLIEVRLMANPPEVWPQWRGPTRDGLVSGTGKWPERLSRDLLEKIWRVPLGRSYSGPIVDASHIYVTESKDNREFVRGLDRKTGQQVWEASWDGSMSVPFFANSNGNWIRATPCLDGDRLYVAGMRDVLVCLNAKDGQTQWQFDFVKELKSPLPAFGFVCSPLIEGEHLYVQAGAAVCKLDKLTGKLIWRAMEDGGGMGGSAFSSPIVSNVAGQRQLLVQTREKLAGLELESGEPLWSETIPSFRGMNILTPTIFGNSVFTSSYGGKSHLFQLAKSNSGLSATSLWTNKASGYMSTPVVIDGHVYLHLQNQRFTCIELATGTTRWTTTPYGKYWSMVANGDRILALDQRGDLLLIQANPAKFELLGTLKISEDETWAHLAICDNEVFIRELSGMVVYRWKYKK